MTPENYKDNFFNSHLAGALRSAEKIIPLVNDFYKPSSVIDIGCGYGAWLSVWKKNGVKNIFGVDGEYVDKKSLLINIEEFHAFDLEKGYTNASRFDLVTCLEVAEHIQAQFSGNFIRSLCSLGDLILFSAAIPGQEGTLHFNEQYPPYWISHFKKNGFVPVDCIRMKIWENKEIEFWYRQNILFFVKENVLANYPSLKMQQEKNPNVPSLVHPEIFDYKSRKTMNYERALRNPFSAMKYFLVKYF